MTDNKISSDLLRGHTDTMILRLLCEADRYGYEIVKLIAERSGGEYELKEATMCSSVRRLEADGDIEWYWGDESQGGRRPARRPGQGRKSELMNEEGVASTPGTSRAARALRRWAALGAGLGLLGGFPAADGNVTAYVDASGDLWMIADELDNGVRVVLVENLRRLVEEILAAREARHEASRTFAEFERSNGSLTVPEFPRKPPTAYVVQLLRLMREHGPRVVPLRTKLEETLATNLPAAIGSPRPKLLET